MSVEQQQAQTPNAEADIKNRALALGAKAVGIASVEAINEYAPGGYRPDDLLRGARSVVVIGGGEPTAGAWRADSHRVLASVGYSRNAAASAARSLANYVEDRYRYYAMPIPTGNKVGHYPYISLKLCAEQAGLGTRSLAGGIVLHPEHGLLYYNGFVTTMPLTADGPLPEPVCPAPSCVAMWEELGTVPCLASCPDCLSGELSNGRIHALRYRQDRCYARAQTTSTDAFQKLLVEAVNEPDAERRKAILFGSHFSRTVRSMAYSSELSAQCFNCMLKCPFNLKRLKGMR
ncbi:MAG: hypothetical protein IT495_16395 [Gammaproteobacteria bacterium]|nr:hypothetical protein [Gammaproteobacteria bacterium]